jgi:hypothetical protein
VFHDLGADNQIKTIAFKGQARNVRCRQSPGSAAVFTQLIVKQKALPGFVKIIAVQI